MVIEARGSNCKILVYVQDLRPTADYRAVLVKRGDDRSRGISLGSVSVDAGRRAETRFDVNPLDVCGSGMAIEEFDTVAVIHNDGRPVIVLSGSNVEDSRWKSNLDIAAAAPAAAPAAPAAAAKKPEPAAKPEPVVQKESYDYDDMPVFLKRDRRDKNEESGERNREHPHIEFKETVMRLNRELTELAELADDRGQRPDDREEQADDHVDDDGDDKAAVDFNAPDSDAWMEITLRELALLPINSFDTEEKALIASSYYTRGKLIMTSAVGTGDGEPSYIIGVPGTKSAAEESGFRRLGFHDFMTARGEEGYWLKKLP
jgi:hypothetical protein